MRSARSGRLEDEAKLESISLRRQMGWHHRIDLATWCRTHQVADKADQAGEGSNDHTYQGFWMQLLWLACLHACTTNRSYIGTARTEIATARKSIEAPLPLFAGTRQRHSKCFSSICSSEGPSLGSRISYPIAVPPSARTLPSSLFPSPSSLPSQPRNIVLHMYTS